MAYRALSVIAFVVLIASQTGRAASEHRGQVTVGTVPVPGATVTASQPGKQVVTSTDQDGLYKFADLADGAWTLKVEMIGFTPVSQDVTVAPDSPPSTWELKLRSFDEITREVPASRVAPAPSPSTAAAKGTPQNAGSPSTPPGGFQRAGVNASNAPPAPASAAIAPVEPPPPDSPLGAADGLLVNGSVNNAAASPFAQLAAFGNNRRSGRALYTGSVGTILGNSAWDARPFSFTTQSTSKPSYSDAQLVGNFGGPVRIPGLLKNATNLFVGFQRTSNHDTNTVPAVMPTSLERLGDFSQSRDAFGRPVQIIDPVTGKPFTNSTIPRDRITPQAAALLGYYPFPNLDSGHFNYQTALVTAVRQDAVQTRVTQPPFGRNQMFGNFAYQRTTTDSTNVFGFMDTTRVSGVDTAINWSHRYSQVFSIRARYQFTHLTTQVTPYFSDRINVSGEAGIAGNAQDSVNWGPPNLIFTSIEGLADGKYTFNRNQTHAWNAESLVGRGRHSITLGGDVRSQHVDVLSQQDPRGSFAFTGSATGSDLADFLLGMPRSSSIAFGNADKFLRASVYDAYVNDDWRMSPSFTMIAGVRWEYETPMSERLGRLVNLDVTPGFTAVSPVVATNPVGGLTSARYPDSLLRPDRRGVQPRLAIAWRPIPGSTLLVRGGYGVYRNTNIYQSIALLMAQQPPLSKAFNVQNTAATPLTLANGFVVAPGATPNTFAVDPDFRVGFAQNWQASVQKDFPASLSVTGTYLGTKGSRLMQEFLPNTYPSGAVNPCPTCVAGFVYLTSGGRSTRHAGQIQLRRRLRNGLTATAQYTLSKAMDDAGAFTGVTLTGAAIAQDWQNLEAEWAPSNFDQRHLLTVQFQYSTGVGIGGGTLIDGLKGVLFKGWTVTSQLTTGSGLPLTPIYLTSVAGTGVTGTLRPDVTGAADATADGFYLNPSAFAAPAPGRWGNAGRNSITGPAQFSLNSGVARTFTVSDRLSLDWRIDASNIINRVTYTGVNTIFDNPQFGLPNRANTMRKLQTTLRLRF
jgi:trimeric autotransporter adhesin